MIWAYLPGKEIEPATAFLLPDSWLYCGDQIGKKTSEYYSPKVCFQTHLCTPLLPDDIMLLRAKQFKL